MQEKYKINQMLFIKGVSQKDCSSMDDVFETRLLTQANDVTVIETYNRLPFLYEGLESWPKKTNLHCWHCCLPFDGIPIFAPKSVEIMATGARRNYIMNREGCFCSFNCALAYIDTYYYRPHDNVNRRGMLEVLFRDFYKVSPKILYKSPSRYEMQQFGGEMTPSDYKKHIASIQQSSGITRNMKKRIDESEFIQACYSP